ncbi:uncharacterized protein YggE [Natronospira proteinivora]|uniref:Uncharacterized protein YggE n=1 Tax=Natronospira proteinivora TaxID=1807133 RepID=A0ABT1G6X7_9GAMM|nr:SIMPL domain-containing protein [Natronospira proteinivora]MCP1727056.1 uncharacterized protein YggE [Natronospira proteinivora]
MREPKWMVLVAAAALLMACSDDPDTVSVSGTAERDFMPDYYDLHLLLEVRGDDRAALSEELESNLDALMRVAQNHGLEEDDIRAWEVQLRQESHYDADEQRRIITGLRLSREVRLRADADQDMGRLIREVLVTEMTQMRRIQPGLEDRDSRRQTLLGEAVENARAQAQALALGDDREVGRLKDVRLAGPAGPGLRAHQMTDQEDASVSFEPEPITISAQVEAVFVLD